MRIPIIDPRHSPLSDEQAAQFNAFLASLGPEQTPWLLGYLAGINQAQSETGVGTIATPPLPQDTAGQLTVLYASQTGNAEKLAKQLVAAAKVAGIDAVALSSADFPPANLRNARHLVLISSTHGEGDPPDSALELRRFLFGKRAPRLEGLRFAVLALGDYSYANFCKAGADFDERLVELGAERVLARVDCDIDFEAAALAWQEQVVAAFGQVAHRGGVVAPSAPVPTAAAAIDDKANPLSVPVVERVNLNGRGSAKQTVHLELSLPGAGFAYQPGDALGVWPRNAPDYVRELIAVAHLAPEARVSVDGQDMPLHTVLAETFEVTTVTRPFLKAYVAETKHADLAKLLEPGQEASLQSFVYGREIIDVLAAYPAASLSAQTFVAMLRRLQPRLYSIASSRLAHDGELHLLVGLTRYESHGRARTGVCSGYLCQRLGEDEPLRVFLSPNPNFRLPENPDARVIMIGPGTGVAPFRAFVEEREAVGGRERNWLFFGDQRFATDFLYQVEWQRWYRSGVLSRLDLAFSRDQADKIYVQQRMREHARDLYAWLQDGAYVYVCGDKGQMAAAVHETLIDIVGQEGGRDRDAAVEYVADLQASKRYQRDVY